MNGKAKDDVRGMGKHRIEALADGIVAVAMTLLVLDIKSPQNLWFDTDHVLALHLASFEHSFVMYAISLVVPVVIAGRIDHLTRGATEDDDPAQ